MTWMCLVQAWCSDVYGRHGWRLRPHSICCMFPMWFSDFCKFLMILGYLICQRFELQMKYRERVLGLILVSPLCKTASWTEWVYNKVLSRTFSSFVHNKVH